MKKKRREVMLYVVQQEAGPVKIGISTDVASRITTLEQVSGQHVNVLGVYTIQDWESHLHALCGEHRTIGEWFTADALRVLLPILPQGTEKRGRPFMAICTVCQKPFACKSRRPRRVCRSELCRRKQAIEVGKAIAHERPDRGGGRPPKLPIESKCAVCGDAVSDKRKRTLCRKPECNLVYGRAQRRERAKCSIAGCGKYVVGRGWCSMHHARWKAHGDPNATVRSYMRKSA